jgi:hypothetical protein
MIRFLHSAVRKMDVFMALNVLVNSIHRPLILAAGWMQLNDTRNQKAALDQAHKKGGKSGRPTRASA